MADPYLVLSPEELQAQEARQLAASHLQSVSPPMSSSAFSSSEEEARQLAAQHLAPPEPAPPSQAVSAAPEQRGFGSRLAVGLGKAFTPHPLVTETAKRLATPEAAKEIAVTAGSMAFGPAGMVPQLNVVTSSHDKSLPKGRERAKSEESVPEAAGPPLPPGESPTEEPIILGQQGGGGVHQVSPAGMYPQSLTTQAHRGRPVPQETIDAYGEATALRLSGAEDAHRANQALHAQEANALQQKVLANQEAASKREAIEAQRRAVVQQRMAEMEAINKEATAQIDPEKYWNDRPALARVLGAISIGLGEFASKMQGGPNTALNIIEGGINREIQAQLQNRQLAGQKYGRVENLLQIHLHHLGDEERAIDATKLAMYDSVLSQVEAYRAQHGIAMDDANYKNLVGSILENKGEVANKIMLQSTDDVNQQYTEAWHNAQYAGGGTGSPAGKMDGYELIPVPASDKTAEKNQLVAVPKGTHQELAKVVGATNTIIGINQDALVRMKELRQDRATLMPTSGASMADRAKALVRLRANMATLEDLAQRKASYLSSSEGQGVLKEAEFERAMKDRVHFNDWWKGEDSVIKRIQAQNNGLAGAAGRMVQGAGGQRVRMAYTRDRNGALQPTPLFTGSPYTPPAVGPEMKSVVDPREGSK